MITQDAVPKGEVVVYPRALVPEADYSVVFRSTKVTRKAKGGLDARRNPLQLDPAR